MSTDRQHALDDWLRRADHLLADDDSALRPDTAHAEESPELIGKLWVKLHKERDLELHVRVGWLAGTDFVQLLDYVPSTGRYETSVMVEGSLLGRLVGELAALGHHSAGSSGSLA